MPNAFGLKKGGILAGYALRLSKRGLLLYPHVQVWVPQISCTLTRNGWLKDIKRCDDVGQFSSAHLHSVFFNTLVCQTVCLTGDSMYLLPYVFMFFWAGVCNKEFFGMLLINATFSSD